MPIDDYLDEHSDGETDTATKAGTDLTYKYQRLRERLRVAIDSGELGDKLPGERVLAKRYNANAKTINKALTDLAMDGLLIRHVGRGTFVAGGAIGDSSLASKARSYGCIVPVGHTQQHGTSFVEHLRQHLGSKGHRLQDSTLQHLPNGELPERALTPGQLRDLSGLVLFGGRLSERFFANLNRRHLPLVMVHNCHEAVRTPAVLMDYAHGTFELTQHLIQLGHQSIRLVTDARLLPGARSAETGFRTALMRCGIEPTAMVVADTTFDGLTLIGDSKPPTAVVCIGCQVATHLLADLKRAGLGVPGQISLALVTESGCLNASEEAITAYEADAGRFVDWAMELLLGASPGQIPRMVVVPGTVQIRRTTALCSQSGPVPTPNGEAIL